MARKKAHKSKILKEILNSTSSLEKLKVEKRMLLAMKIKQAIVNSNMSNSEFALKTGKTKSTISRWLSGTHNFTIDTISEIENALGVKLDNIKSEKFIQPRYSLNISINANNKSKINNVLGNQLLNTDVFSFHQEEIKC